MKMDLQLFAVAKVLARGWKIEIDTGTGVPTWTPILGINTFTFSGEKNDADTTTFDSNGWNEHIPASRGRSLSAEGTFLEDTAGLRDPGQEAVDDLGELIGAEGLGDFRLTSPGGKVRTFVASVNTGDIGGGNDDPTSWGFELTVSGKVTQT